jgi:glycosyltransferase involved in cell wall biosynthesis
MRVLVVSHPCVLPVNQTVYRVLRQRGWDISVIVPSRWRHAFSESVFAAEPLEGLERVLEPSPVLFAGAPQRHVYRVRPAKVLRRYRPDVVFLEQEPFSVSAFQWGRAAFRLNIPFGVQAAENLNRRLPLPARMMRYWTLPRADFVAARSPGAAQLAQSWGAEGVVALAPHAVPVWQAADTAGNQETDVFTVGYAGRLVPEKGIEVLLRAVRRMSPPVRLLIAGDGPLAGAVRAASSPTLTVDVVRGLSHDEMNSVFRRMDVLVLPSLTTATWTEQFGRVLVEAMSEGVPVVGSDAGEIPWVIETTGGGLTVPEGDDVGLAAALERLRDDPRHRHELGVRGRRAVDDLFSAESAASALERLLHGALADAGV